MRAQRVASVSTGSAVAVPRLCKSHLGTAGVGRALTLPGPVRSSAESVQRAAVRECTCRVWEGVPVAGAGWYEIPDEGTGRVRGDPRLAQWDYLYADESGWTAGEAELVARRGRLSPSGSTLGHSSGSSCPQTLRPRSAPCPVTGGTLASTDFARTSRPL